MLTNRGFVYSKADLIWGKITLVFQYWYFNHFTKLKIEIFCLGDIRKRFSDWPASFVALIKCVCCSWHVIHFGDIKKYVEAAGIKIMTNGF